MVYYLTAKVYDLPAIDIRRLKSVYFGVEWRNSK